MKHQRRLNSQEQAQEQTQASTNLEAAKRESIEFDSTEEMLRHDAIHTPVPPAISYRLQQSISHLPPPPRSWWQRLFRP